MSLIQDIAELMLREGEIKGQAAREQIAEQEEMRQAKHRLLKNTLKGLAMFGPMFLPGGQLWGALSSGAVLGSNRGIGPDTDRLQEYRSTDGYY